MLVEFICIFFGLLGIVYFYLTANDNYWKKRGIPFVKPDLLFGNFKDAFLGRRHFGLMYCDLYNKFSESPLVGVMRSTEPVLLVRDPEIATTVMITEFRSFTDNDFTVNLEKDPMWGSSPFSNKGEVWKALRARWTPHMTPGRVKQIYSSMVNRADIMVEHIMKKVKADPKTEFLARDLVASFLTDSIALGTFGIEINSYESPQNPFKRISDIVFESDYWANIISALFVVAPWLAKIVSFESRELLELAFIAAKDIIKCQKETGLPKNEVYTALTNYSIADGKAGFSELDLAERIFGMLLDGSETTSGPVSFGLFEIACNPNVQTRLQAELDEAAAANGGSLNYKVVDQLPYLDMIFSETLRHYPPLIHITRVCTQPITLKKDDTQIQVPVGMTVAVPLLGIHMDPRYFPDPYKFDPEHFAPGMAETRPKGTYMPFGGGPRTCLGMRLGTVEAKVVLANLAKNFIIRPVGDRYERPIPVDPNIFVMRPAEELKVTFSARTHGDTFS